MDKTSQKEFGFCIYCRKAGVSLSDEHVVPHSLGGEHVLLNATCKRCAKITSKFELDVARELWGDARYAYGGKSRNNKPSRQRQKRLKTRDWIDIPPVKPGQKKIRVRYDEYPAALVYYQMGKAGILQGLPPDVDLSKQWLLKAEADQPRSEAFLKKYPEQLVTKFRHVPESFGRMIAKIAYCQMLTTLDPDDFTPLCLEYILGNRTNVSYIVGGDSRNGVPENTGYRLESCACGNFNEILLIGTVRLMANLHSPYHYAVVGYVRGRERVEQVMRKMGNKSITPTMPTFLSSDKTTECWEPDVWPLNHFKQ
ncbi:conserved protein [Tepidicaulis marinus]|uniref:Conserved protein n=1 Tax=Tepidicaulis marinus TaxID=1333998 RepID=A0A081BF28_9HYPH|nr:HNH endonuclease [Tepidicaulis marinus]GAK46646.1 conserved protein [Tepidicaulis marinus]